MVQPGEPGGQGAGAGVRRGAGLEMRSERYGGVPTPGFSASLRGHSGRST